MVWDGRGNILNEDGKTWFHTNESVYVSPFYVYTHFFMYKVVSFFLPPGKITRRGKEKRSLKSTSHSCRRETTEMMKWKDEWFCKHEWILRVNTGKNVSWAVYGAIFFFTLRQSSSSALAFSFRVAGGSGMSSGVLSHFWWGLVGCREFLSELHLPLGVTKVTVLRRGEVWRGGEGG